MGRLTKDEVAGVISNAIAIDIEPAGRNWLLILSEPLRGRKIFYSQCKPSSASKGKWEYDFWHTIDHRTVQNIVAEYGQMVLINYIDKTYCFLNVEDIHWVQKYSRRTHSNSGAVCDFVIDRSYSGNYHLRPYDRQNRERRLVEVKGW